MIGSLIMFSKHKHISIIWLYFILQYMHSCVLPVYLTKKELGNHVGSG